MRFSITINNPIAIRLGLNIQQAYLFAWFYELPSWAESVFISGQTYFFASKNKAIEELPLLTNKPDTMYRYYKQIETLGLIEIKKIDSKDYVRVLDIGKCWNEWKSEHSEKNPNTLGKKSVNHSEKNPTNNNTSINNNTSNKKDLFSGSENPVEVKPISKDILDYLNNKKPSKRPFEPTRANLKHIEARIKEKFKTEDFKKVIDFKIDSWAGNHMKKYIRPETLFGEKFNGYLIEAQDYVSEENNNFGNSNFKKHETSENDLL